MSSNIALVSLYGVENNGVRSIASILKARGFNTHLIFFKRWVNNDIRYPTVKEKEILLSLLKELDIEIVGFSFTSPFFKIARELTEGVKKYLSAKVVWGGMHATVRPEESLRSCDVVCRGEGEDAMVELVRALVDGSSLKGIKNIGYRQNGKSILEEMRPLISDLDTLPHQDYGSDHKYFIEGDLKAVDPLSYARELRVFASRGCPYNCSYCYNSVLRRLYKSEGYYRIRSPAKVISEIRYALGQFPNIRKIKFDDDTFVFPKEWIRLFKDAYKSSVNLPFEIMLKSESADQESLKELRFAGLKRVQVGIQTGSYQESGEFYNRELSLEKIASFARFAKEQKLEVVYDVILDNPLAKYEDQEALALFLLSLPRPFDLFLYSLTVFPETRLCEDFIKRGLIKPEEVEGEANKSFYQFRFSFSYPRSKQELFIACIISLTSKSFIPRALIAGLLKTDFLKKHPFPLKWFAILCNQIKLLHILAVMTLRQEVNFWKFREYGAPKRFLIQ